MKLLFLFGEFLKNVPQYSDIDSYGTPTRCWPRTGTSKHVSVISRRSGLTSVHCRAGEQHMLRFLVAVWLGENRLNFDLIDATKALSEDNLNEIRAWLNCHHPEKRKKPTLKISDTAFKVSLSFHLDT